MPPKKNYGPPRTDFGPAPPGYIPGVGRGAKAFSTRGDLGTSTVDEKGATKGAMERRRKEEQNEAEILLSDNKLLQAQEMAKGTYNRVEDEMNLLKEKARMKKMAHIVQQNALLAQKAAQNGANGQWDWLNGSGDAVVAQNNAVGLVQYRDGAILNQNGQNLLQNGQNLLQNGQNGTNLDKNGIISATTSTGGTISFSTPLTSRTDLQQQGGFLQQQQQLQLKQQNLSKTGPNGPNLTQNDPNVTKNIQNITKTPHIPSARDSYLNLINPNLTAELEQQKEGLKLIQNDVWYKLPDALGILGDKRKKEEKNDFSHFSPLDYFTNKSNLQSQLDAARGTTTSLNKTIGDQDDAYDDELYGKSDPNGQKWSQNGLNPVEITTRLGKTVTLDAELSNYRSFYAVMYHLFPVELDGSGKMGSKGGGDPKIMIKLLQSQVKTNPNNVSAWLSLIEMTYTTGQVTEAMDIMKMALKTCPKSDELWLFSVRLASMEKNQKNSLEPMLENAIKLCPRSLSLWKLYIELARHRNQRVERIVRSLGEFKTNLELWFLYFDLLETPQEIVSTILSLLTPSHSSSTSMSDLNNEITVGNSLTGAQLPTKVMFEKVAKMKLWKYLLLLMFYITAPSPQSISDWVQYYTAHPSLSFHTVSIEESSEQEGENSNVDLADCLDMNDGDDQKTQQKVKKPQNPWEVGYSYTMAYLQMFLSQKEFTTDFTVWAFGGYLEARYSDIYTYCTKAVANKRFKERVVENAQKNVKNDESEKNNQIVSNSPYPSPTQLNNSLITLLSTTSDANGITDSRDTDHQRVNELFLKNLSIQFHKTPLPSLTLSPSNLYQLYGPSTHLPKTLELNYFSHIPPPNQAAIGTNGPNGPNDQNAVQNGQNEEEIYKNKVKMALFSLKSRLQLEFYSVSCKPDPVFNHLLLVGTGKGGINDVDGPNGQKRTRNGPNGTKMNQNGHFLDNQGQNLQTDIGQNFPFIDTKTHTIGLFGLISNQVVDPNVLVGLYVNTRGRNSAQNGQNGQNGANLAQNGQNAPNNAQNGSQSLYSPLTKLNQHYTSAWNINTRVLGLKQQIFAQKNNNETMSFGHLFDLFTKNSQIEKKIEKKSDLEKKSENWEEVETLSFPFIFDEFISCEQNTNYSLLSTLSRTWLLPLIALLTKRAAGPGEISCIYDYLLDQAKRVGNLGYLNASRAIILTIFLSIIALAKDVENSTNSLQGPLSGDTAVIEGVAVMMGKSVNLSSILINLILLLIKIDTILNDRATKQHNIEFKMLFDNSSTGFGVKNEINGSDMTQNGPNSTQNAQNAKNTKNSHLSQTLLTTLSFWSQLDTAMSYVYLINNITRNRLLCGNTTNLFHQLVSFFNETHNFDQCFYLLSATHLQLEYIKRLKSTQHPARAALERFWAQKRLSETQMKTNGLKMDQSDQNEDKMSQNEEKMSQNEEKMSQNEEKMSQNDPFGQDDDETTPSLIQSDYWNSISFFILAYQLKLKQFSLNKAHNSDQNGQNGQNGQNSQNQQYLQQQQAIMLLTKSCQDTKEPLLYLHLVQLMRGMHYAERQNDLYKVQFEQNLKKMSQNAPNLASLGQNGRVIAALAPTMNQPGGGQLQQQSQQQQSQQQQSQDSRISIIKTLVAAQKPKFIDLLEKMLLKPQNAQNVQNVQNAQNLQNVQNAQNSQNGPNSTQNGSILSQKYPFLSQYGTLYTDATSRYITHWNETSGVVKNAFASARGQNGVRNAQNGQNGPNQAQNGQNGPNQAQNGPSSLIYPDLSAQDQHTIGYYLATSPVVFVMWVELLSFYLDQIKIFTILSTIMPQNTQNAQNNPQNAQNSQNNAPNSLQTTSSTPKPLQAAPVARLMGHLKSIFDQCIEFYVKFSPSPPFFSSLNRPHGLPGSLWTPAAISLSFLINFHLPFSYFNTPLEYFLVNFAHFDAKTFILPLFSTALTTPLLQLLSSTNSFNATISFNAGLTSIDAKMGQIQAFEAKNSIFSLFSANLGKNSLSIAQMLQFDFISNPKNSPFLQKMRYWFGFGLDSVRNGAIKVVIKTEMDKNAYLGKKMLGDKPHNDQNGQTGQNGVKMEQNDDILIKNETNMTISPLFPPQSPSSRANLHNNTSIMSYPIHLVPKKVQNDPKMSNLGLLGSPNGQNDENTIIHPSFSILNPIPPHQSLTPSSTASNNIGSQRLVIAMADLRGLFNALLAQNEDENSQNGPNSSKNAQNAPNPPQIGPNAPKSPPPSIKNKLTTFHHVWLANWSEVAVLELENHPQNGFGSVLRAFMSHFDLMPLVRRLQYYGHAFHSITSSGGIKDGVVGFHPDDVNGVQMGQNGPNSAQNGPNNAQKWSNSAQNGPQDDDLADNPTDDHETRQAKAFLRQQKMQHQLVGTDGGKLPLTVQVCLFSAKYLWTQQKIPLSFLWFIQCIDTYLQTIKILGHLSLMPAGTTRGMVMDDVVGGEKRLRSVNLGPNGTKNGKNGQNGQKAANLAQNQQNQHNTASLSTTIDLFALPALYTSACNDLVVGNGQNNGQNAQNGQNNDQNGQNNDQKGQNDEISLKINDVMMPILDPVISSSLLSNTMLQYQFIQPPQQQQQGQNGPNNAQNGQNRANLTQSAPNALKIFTSLQQSNRFLSLGLYPGLVNTGRGLAPTQFALRYKRNPNEENNATNDQNGQINVQNGQNNVQNDLKPQNVSKLTPSLQTSTTLSYSSNLLLTTPVLRSNIGDVLIWFYLFIAEQCFTSSQSKLSNALNPYQNKLSYQNNVSGDSNPSNSSLSQNKSSDAQNPSNLSTLTKGDVNKIGMGDGDPKKQGDGGIQDANQQNQQKTENNENNDNFGNNNINNTQKQKPHTPCLCTMVLPQYITHIIDNSGIIDGELWQYCMDVYLEYCKGVVVGINDCQEINNNLSNDNNNNSQQKNNINNNNNNNTNNINNISSPLIEIVTYRTQYDVWIELLGESASSISMNSSRNVMMMVDFVMAVLKFSRFFINVVFNKPIHICDHHN